MCKYLHGSAGLISSYDSANVPPIIMPQKYFTATVLSSSEHRWVHGSYNKKKNNNKKGWLKTCVKFDTFATHAALFATSLISALQMTMYTAGHKMTERSLTLPTLHSHVFMTFKLIQS